MAWWKVSSTAITICFFRMVALSLEVQRDIQSFILVILVRTPEVFITNVSVNDKPVDHRIDTAILSAPVNQLEQIDPLNSINPFRLA